MHKFNHNKKTTTVVARLFAAVTKAEYVKEIYYDFLIKTLELTDQFVIYVFGELTSI